MDTKVLVVDDSKFNLRLLTEILKSEGYTVFNAENGSIAIDKVHQLRPDIILLDVVMPGIDGFEVCRILKADFDTKDIPVIMVTTKSEGIDVKRALEQGAFDFIRKPVDEDEVVARVKSALKFKQYQDLLKEMAMKDGLTGLYNHSLLMELFEKEAAKQQRKGANICFAMLDIDHFKKINDTYGHMAGDDVLRGLSSLLTSSLRMCDIVGRYGGEEFGIVLPDIQYKDAYFLFERIRRTIEKHDFHIGNQTIKITVSIGICHKGPKDILAITEMIKNADDALYSAKRSGRNCVTIYPFEDALKSV